MERLQEETTKFKRNSLEEASPNYSSTITSIGSLRLFQHAANQRAKEASNHLLICRFASMYWIGLTTVFSLIASPSLSLDTEWLSWCGKHYQPGSPAVPPLGKMKPPERSSIPLLDFRCTPTIQPYLSNDVSASILLDLHTSWTHGVPITSPGIVFAQEAEDDWFRSKDSLYEVIITATTTSSHSETYLLLTSSIPLNSTTEAFFDISLLPPGFDPYTITCSLASLPRRPFGESKLSEATSLLRILPETNPWGGGTTRIDRRKGSILVPSVGGWEPILPVGFYTSYGDYLAKDVSHLDEMKKLGFNTVHPVPTFDDIDILKKVLDRAEEIGLWLMYDMRHTYTDSIKVKAQVEMIQSYKNLLVWYTADEPDGNEDPLSSTRTAYDQIYELDKGYHPVSLVLNCADYFFADHVSGADVVLVDTYSFNVNLTFSSTWHTPCNETYGCCGCDDCSYGNARDVSERLDRMNEYRIWLGWERRITFWGVPQAFGGSEYWTSEPTAQELLLSSVLGLIHGTRGIIPWVAPTSNSLTSAFSTLSNHISDTLSPIILYQGSFVSPVDSFVGSPDIHLAGWSRGNEAIVLLAHLGNKREDVEVYVNEKAMRGYKNSKWVVRDVFDTESDVRLVGGEKHDGNALRLKGVLQGGGIAAWIISQD